MAFTYLNPFLKDLFDRSGCFSFFFGDVQVVDLVGRTDTRGPVPLPVGLLALLTLGNIIPPTGKVEQEDEHSNAIACNARR